MAAVNRSTFVLLVVVTAAAAELALTAQFYHRWWWWDILMHAIMSGLLAVWGHLIDVPPRWAWPLFVAGMLFWEWIELATPLLYSPTQQDILKDLTVNVVVFGSLWTALSFEYPDDLSVPRSFLRFGS